MFFLRCGQYFSHITTATYTFHVFPGFQQAAALKYLAQGYSHVKTQMIQCSSNPGPLDNESNTLPLSNVRHCGKERNTTYHRFLQLQRRLLPLSVFEQPFNLKYQCITQFSFEINDHTYKS